MLNETVKKAYDIFSKYRVDRPLDVCTNECCMKVEDEGRLASLPVGQIPVELLKKYNDSAKPEKTRIEEVKYFLPRYLELISEFNFPTHSTELSFSRLTPFDKNEWTESELKLLDTFAKDFFRHCLSTYPIPSFNDRIDNILIMFWIAKFDIYCLLKIWEQTNSLASVLHFKDLYFEGFSQYHRNKLSSGFGDIELCAVLTNWINSKSAKERFEQYIEQTLLGENEFDERTTYELNLLYDIVRKDKQNAT